MQDNRQTPRRPALTPVFICGLAFWIGSAVAYETCLYQKGSCLASVSIVIAIAIVCLAVLGLARRKSYCMALACLSAGALLSISTAWQLHTTGEAIDGTTISEATATVAQDAERTSFGTRAIVYVDVAHDRRIKAVAYFTNAARAPAMQDPDDSSLSADNETSTEEALLAGQALLVTGSLQAVDNAEGAYWWGRGVAVSIKVAKMSSIRSKSPLGFVHRVRENALSSIGAETQEDVVAQALACGYRAGLNDSHVYSTYQSAGLAHLVAVSGAHLVIVTGMLSSVLRVLRCPRRVSVTLLIALMASYTLVAGAPLSCIRAAVMSSVGILAILGKRRPSTMNALGICLFAIIAFDPSSSVSTSLALSALSTLGIVMFDPLIAYALERIVPANKDSFIEPLALTVSASMMSQPYACSLFSVLPLVSPLANILVAPIFPLCCALSLMTALAGIVGLPFLNVLHSATRGAIWLMNSLIAWIVEIPYSAVPVSIPTLVALMISTSSALLVWLLWNRICLLRASHCALCLPIFIAFAFALSVVPKGDYIALLDVGQGDAYLVSSSGRTLLIDTGNQDSQLIDQLARCGIAHLDAVLITHADDDHCGSLDALQKAVAVDQVIVADGIPTCKDSSCEKLADQAYKTAPVLTQVKTGDTFRIGKFTAHVLWPSYLQDSGGNADSIMLYVEYDCDGDEVSDFDSLFTGDAEIDQLAQVLSTWPVRDIDLLKVGHHGSRNAMTDAQAQNLNPSIALIGVGAGNRYGHPTQEILDMLDQIGCTVFRSDIDGGVKLSLKGNSVSARRL